MVSIHEPLTSDSISSASSASEGEEFMTKAAKTKLKSLVPKYVRNFCKYPDTASLQVFHDKPTSDTIYQYTITWEQPLDDEQLRRKLSSTCLSEEPLSSPSLIEIEPRPRAVSVCHTPTLISHKSTQWSIHKDFMGAPPTVHSSASSNRYFLKSHVDEDKLIDVLLIVLEPGNPGVFYNYFTAQLNSSQTIKELATHILERENRDVKHYLKRGTLYKVRLNKDQTRENVLVKKDEYKEIKIFQCPLILCRAVFVLDLKEFVAEGVPVYF